ncbi:hypothetical protein SOPP22_09950 [Shewanella sp. OPT22]|nr:hypothetical protein SOPP22_09950 [Shewanella sp. OPT22]
MRITFFALMVITLLFAVYIEKSTVNTTVVMNVDFAKTFSVKANDQMHSKERGQTAERHTAEKEDNCCDVDCCDSNCICIANACSPFASVTANVRSTQVVFSIESVYDQRSESPTFISNSHYRPPRVTS